MQKICHFAFSSVHTSCGTSFAVRTNVITFFFNVRFFFITRFALIPRGAHRETSENIDTDLADALDRQSLWGTECEVLQ